MQVRALESTCPLHMSEHGSERVGLALGSRSATVPKMSVLWGYAGAGTCPNKSGYNTCSVNPSLDDLSASGASVARGPWRSCIRLIDYRTFAADAGRGEPSFAHSNVTLHFAGHAFHIEETVSSGDVTSIKIKDFVFNVHVLTMYPSAPFHGNCMIIYIVCPYSVQYVRLSVLTTLMQPDQGSTEHRAHSTGCILRPPLVRHLLATW